MLNQNLLPLVLVMSFAVHAGELDDLKAKVNELDAQVTKLNRQSAVSQDRVRTFFAQSIALGGFFENGITSIWGEDTPTQTVADSQRLGLNLSAEVSERFLLVGQISFGFSYPLRNEHNNPSHGSTLIPEERSYGGVTYGSLLSQIYGDYAFSNKLHLQTGMGFVPYGQAFQIREPVLFNKRRGPQLIRTSGVTRVVIANPFWQGLNAVWTPSASWRFNLYTQSALDHSGKPGGGARAAFEVENRWTLGLSYQTGGQSDEYYHSGGVDLRVENEWIGVQAEYGRNSTEDGDPESFYIQPYIRLMDTKLTVFISVDYLKNPAGETTLGSASVSDPYIKWENTFGFVYQFMPNVRGRLDYTLHDYTGDRAVVAGQDRDYHSISVSSGVSF